jgi:glycosyltransferase involved in cell wall biosynthesis
MKVAIVHYWLVTMRGGEKVLEALLELFPDADIYTHVYDPSAVSDLINSHTIYTSFINKLPFAKKLYQKYMPLMPDALKEFDLQNYDLIISSESGPAKGIIPNPDAYHICYCHTPMRYLWDMYQEYFNNAGWISRFFMKRMIPSLRLWDITSSNLVDRFIANSSYTAKRIRRYYNRDSVIVYPPVNIERYLSIERKKEDFYLFLGQIVGYKRADIAIKACQSSGRRLVVIGAGGKETGVKKYKNAGLITFTGRISDEEIASYFSRARALLFPGIEDFGIVPVEANAAGCPVIAYRKGGAVDSIEDMVTGVFFDEQTPESLVKAIEKFESLEYRFSDRSPFTDHVNRFSRESFKQGMIHIIEEKLRV